MALSVLLIILGLVLLVWSADLFVDGAAILARYWGLPSLLIGMVVIGFGTSAPELTVSALSAFHGNPGLALGNAYGSNITNIALILGSVSLITPILVKSQVIRKELPVLMAVTVFVYAQVYDGELSRLNAGLDLLVFVLVMGWMVRTAGQHKDPADQLEQEMEEEQAERAIVSREQAWVWLLGGLVFLVISSQMLVTGAVAIAHTLGVSDLVIGLTIVAVGTSLPELASSLIAARKGEDDLALGNIIGSNLFNTLAVVGVAGVMHPMTIPLEIIHRDWPLMAGLTASLLVMGYNSKRQGRINRLEGGVLLGVYALYTLYLVNTIVSA